MNENATTFLTTTEQQVAEYLEQQVRCPCCGKKRRRKGNHNSLVYRTLFGKLHLPSMRFFHCGCRPHATRTFSPLAQLLTQRTAPELPYLEIKFASLMSYGLTVDILQEILPLGKTINAATVRNNVHAVGQRINKALGDEKVFFIDGCEHDWKRLPWPDMPLTVGLDGGYVHSNSQNSRQEVWFEVIAGKSVTAEGASKRFAFVDIDVEAPTQKHQKLLKKLNEFQTYIRNNAGFIPNYGERWRYGESISTAFVESIINQVVSKRMVKKQQMRWCQRGTHLLLQVRTRVLNDELREQFQQWYPKFAQQGQP